MARWHNIRLRGDLYEVLFHRATQDRRSVAQMADVLLTRALEREPGLPADAPSPEGRSNRAGTATPVSARAPVAQRIEGQTTVDEMLASCPQCAGELQTVDVTRGGSTIREGTEACVDCGWVREPSDG